MNYLLHLLLSEPDDEHYIGNILGDFVKGRLDQQFAPNIMAGLRHHRRIDTFAHTNATFQRSIQRLDPSFGRYRPIMIDMFYDHFTARNWHHYSDTPLETFAQHIYQILQQQPDLPPKFNAILPRMIEYNWLVAYSNTSAIQSALSNLSRRISRPNPLAEGLDQLLNNYDDLHSDCHEFIVAARRI